MENNDQKGESYRAPPEDGGEGRSAKAGLAQLKYLEEAKRIVLSFDEIKEYAVLSLGAVQMVPHTSVRILILAYWVNKLCRLLLS